jgi:predicted amidohydrolase YtcJ
MPRSIRPLPERATRILHNGVVHTQWHNGGWQTAQAIALAGDRVLATGDNAAIMSLAAPLAQRTDLNGRCVIPGLIDSHNHMLATGLNAALVDLSAARSIGDVLEAMRARAEASEGWLISSSRWHESQLSEQRFPTRGELDGVAPERPLLIRRGGHNVVVNSVALSLAGIDERTPDPPGGTYVRDANGSLTGHVIGAPAYARIVRLLPETTQGERLTAIERACRMYNAAGITAVIEPGLSAEEFRAYQRARRAGSLTVRTSLMPRLVPGTTPEALASAVESLRGWPVTTGFGDDLLAVGGIKVGADGGVETNFLREPFAFADDPTSPRGKPQVSAENLTAFCVEAARLRWQVGVHCVGDAAIDLVLDAYAAADRAHGIGDLRWTLIHMTLAHPDQIARARALRLCIAAQQPLIYSLGAGWLKYWGEERAAAASPLDLYARSGLPVGGGSDSPVTRFEPLIGISSSATRATELAGVLGPEHAISAGEALRWYTSGSAYLMNAEERLGVLTPGALADLVVLSGDPLATNPEEIASISVEETLLGGETVFAR